MSKKQCKVEGCTSQVLARGWCSLHYYRWKRTGEPGGLERRNRHYDGQSCDVDGCDKKAERRGWCSMHYTRWRTDGDPGEAESRYMEPTPDGLCSVDGCDNEMFARQLCPMHLARVKTHGDPGPAERIRQKRGGRVKTDTGYIRVHEPDHPDCYSDGYVLEHRLVMEQQLGRRLSKDENVHHRNGVRDDNRPENLELWVKPQLPGQRVEDLVAWVVDRYPEYVRAVIEGRGQLQIES